MCENKSQNIILQAFVSSRVVSRVERGMFFLSRYITSMQDAFIYAYRMASPLRVGIARHNTAGKS